MPEDVRFPQGPRFTRRRLLAGGAIAGGAALSSLALPPNVRRALAAPPPTSSQPSLSDVEHVVLLMQENRSFDHYFGTFPGVRGFGDPNALKLSTGRSVFYQPDPTNPDGYLLPYHLDTLTTSAQAMPSTSHAWQVQHQAWDGGAMDDWLPADIASDGAERRTVHDGLLRDGRHPVPAALADTFTICDNYYCSVLGPTHPNRYVWMTGTIDPNGENGGPALDNNITDGRYTWTTYAEHLTAAGVSWRCYQETDNYGTNVLEFFKQYQAGADELAAVPERHGQLPGGQVRVRRHQRPTADGELDLPDEHSVRASLLPAGRRRRLRGLEDRRHRRQSRRLGQDGVLARLRRERRAVRPRTAPDSPGGTADEFVTLTSPGGTPGAGYPSGPASGCPASSCRRGPPAAGYAAKRSTTPRTCASWSSSPGWRRPTSPRSAERRSGT